MDQMAQKQQKLLKNPAIFSSIRRAHITPLFIIEKNGKMIRKEIKEKISRNKALLEEKYNVKSIGIFGSSTKDTFDKNSDIDILVEFSKTPDIFEFIELEEFLSNLLGAKVDLVTKKALKPIIKESILKETIYI